MSPQRRRRTDTVAPPDVGFDRPPRRTVVEDDPNFPGSTAPYKKPKRGFASRCSPEQSRLAKVVCSLLGATHEQLAAVLGIHSDTLREWINNNEDFFKAVRQGKDQFNTRKVEAALLQRALGFEYDEVTREQIEIKDGKESTPLPGVKVKVTRKIFAPDVTAGIFFLINRTRHSGRWQNVQNIKISGQIDQGISLDMSKMTEKELVSFKQLMSKIPMLTANQVDGIEPADAIEVETEG